jgi:sugar/nucleoside kinase (ribokinase family)
MARIYGGAKVNSRGRSVRIVLAEGIPTGIVTAEVMNWTGHVLAGPRSRLEKAFARSELKRTGVYFIFGDDDTEGGQPLLYIGEGDDISKRLASHNKDKDFWTRFIAITSKDLNLTKAHVRYLESRLIEIAGHANRSALINKDRPQFDLLPEADIADMETFLEEIQLVLPVLGADFLKAVSHTQSTSSDKRSAQNAQDETGHVTFVLQAEKWGIDATAQEAEGEFVILAGSHGSLKEKPSFYGRAKQLRDRLLQTGVLRVTSDDTFVCQSDITFSSPSSAAKFLWGTSRNGRTDWKEAVTTASYADFKDSLLPSNED